MRHTAYNKLVSLIVLPALVFAHLFCVCPAAAAPVTTLPAVVSPVDEPVPHACHAKKSAAGNAGAHDGLPAPEDSPDGSSCSHCGEGGQASVVSPRSAVADGPTPPLPFVLPPSLSSLLAPLDIARHRRPPAGLPSDTPLPIQPLRMKCALLI